MWAAATAAAACAENAGIHNTKAFKKNWFVRFSLSVHAASEDQWSNKHCRNASACDARAGCARKARAILAWHGLVVPRLSAHDASWRLCANSGAHAIARSTTLLLVLGLGRRTSSTHDSTWSEESGVTATPATPAAPAAHVNMSTKTGHTLMRLSSSVVSFIHWLSKGSHSCESLPAPPSQHAHKKPSAKWAMCRRGLFKHRRLKHVPRRMSLASSTCTRACSNARTRSWWGSGCSKLAKLAPPP